MKEKLIAGLMAALTALTTVYPVLAVTLDDFTKYLGEPVQDFLIVIGSRAAISDVVGAADIAIALAAQSTQPVTVPGVGVAVEGKEGEMSLESEDMRNALGSELTPSDVPALFRGTLEQNRTKYVVEEKIIVPEAPVQIDAVTLNGTVYLDFSSKTPTYVYEIVDGLGVGNFSETKPLEVKLFGQSLLIKSAEDGKLVAFSGVYGKASPTVPVVYGDYKVYADIGVSDDWAHVYVMKGETKVGEEYIEIGDKETIGDLDIKLLGVVALPMEATVVRADLVVGPTGETEKEYIENDNFPGTELWKFSDIIVDSNLLKAINITYTPEEEADYYLKPEEKLAVPNNYVDIGFKGFKVNKFATLTAKTGTVSLYQTATSTSPIASYKNRPAIVLESNYPIFNSKRSTTAYLVLNASDDVIGLGYLDPRENKAVLDSEDNTTISFGAEFGGTPVSIEFNVSSLQNLTLTVDSESIEANYTFKHDTTDTVALGERLKAEESDITVSWDADVNGEWEYDTVSEYGLILNTVQANAKNDKVVIQIPEEQQKAVVYVGKLGAAAGEEYVVYKPVVNPVARLDTELTSVDKTKNLVSVGGPCVNEISYNALKAAGVVTVAYPACGADSSIPENAAIIRVVEDYPATGKFTVVVAGWEATNTRVASAALMQYKEKLAGQPAAVKVSGTIEAPVITPL